MMHDTTTSTWSITCMANDKEKHIPYAGIIGFPIKLGHAWPILTLPHKPVKWRKHHGFQTLEMFSPGIKHDTVASINTK